MKKYAIVEMSTKKRTCDTESINMWIHANKAYCFADFSNVTSSRHHNNLYWTYEFRFEIRVSNVIFVLNFNRDIAM